MKLTDLDPHWVGSGGEGVRNADGSPVPRRERIGIHLNCPCGCKYDLFVPFKNPVDGLGPTDPRQGWERTGDSFENLTLRPSILRVSPCPSNWHGYITNGEIQTC